MFCGVKWNIYFHKISTMYISTKFPRCIFDIGIFNVFSLQLSLSWGSPDLVYYWPNSKALIHRTLFWVKSILMLTHFSKEFWQSVCLSEVPLDCVLTLASESQQGRLNNRTLGIAIISINSDTAPSITPGTESNCFAVLFGWSSVLGMSTRRGWSDSILAFSILLQTFGHTKTFLRKLKCS